MKMTSLWHTKVKPFQVEGRKEISKFLYLTDFSKIQTPFPIVLVPTTTHESVRGGEEGLGLIFFSLFLFNISFWKTTPQYGLPQAHHRGWAWGKFLEGFIRKGKKKELKLVTK